jgi:GcrA cell cycle regulator
MSNFDPRPVNESWSEESIDHLRALAATGMSSNDMGTALGRTKNAVVGKCHRMKIEMLQPFFGGVKRVRKNGAPPPQPHQTAKAVIRRVGPVSLPALASVAVPLPTPPVPAVAPRMTGMCCWPEGEPGTRDFRYCDAACDWRRTYCVAHDRIAHMKRKVVEA